MCLTGKGDSCPSVVWNICHALAHEEKALGPASCASPAYEAEGISVIQDWDCTVQAWQLHTHCEPGLVAE